VKHVFPTTGPRGKVLKNAASRGIHLTPLVPSVWRQTKKRLRLRSTGVDASAPRARAAARHAELASRWATTVNAREPKYADISNAQHRDCERTRSLVSLGYTSKRRDNAPATRYLGGRRPRLPSPSRIHKPHLYPRVSNSYPVRERERDPLSTIPAHTRSAAAKSLGAHTSTPGCTHTTVHSEL